jgi:hypothetical protein
MNYQVILTIFDNDGVGYLVDLYENEELYFTKQFSDLLDFTARGSYSKTFRIPASQRNVVSFGALYNVNANTWFDFRKKVPAVLTVDTVTVSEGHIQVKTVYSNNDALYEYEIIFYGEALEASRNIGDKLLSQLDYSSLNHILNYQNILDINSGSLLNDDVCYTLTDKGFNFAEVSGYRRVYDPLSPVAQSELTLAIKVLWLFNKILEEGDIQYNLDSDMENELGHMYTPFITDQHIVPNITLEEAYFTVAFSSNFPWNVIAAGGNSTAQLPAPNTAYWGDNISQFMDTVILDVVGNFNTTNGEYTVPFAGAFSFEFVMCSGNNNGTINEPFDMISTWLTPYAIINGVNTMLTTQATGFGGSAPDPSILTWTFTLNLNTGDTVALGLASYFSSDFWLIRGDGAIATPNSTWWKMTNVVAASYSFPVAVKRNAPNISQLDYLKGILKMFNAVIVPSKSSPNTVDIVPMTTYLGSGNKVDWTHKLDVSQDIVIKPTTDIQKAKVTFTYQDDADMFNQLYKKGQQRVFGEQRIDQPNNDFATGEETISVPFAATPSNKVENTTDIVIPKFFDTTGKFVIPKCRVLYRTGYSLSGVMVHDEIANYGASTNLPQLSNYSEGIYSGTGSYDLNWGEDIPLHTLIATPVNTLYYRFWSLYFAQIYSYESRIIEAYFYLNHVDATSINFNDIIFVRDSYYRLISINDHKLGGQEVCKVTLMKYLADIPVNCGLVPIGSNIDGSIIWEDTGGHQSSGTQACCEAYGWNWVDNGHGKAACYSSPQAPANITEITKPPIGKPDSPYSLQKSLFVGLNETDPQSNNAERSVIVGVNNLSRDIINSVVLGSSARALNSGLTIGGGERGIENLYGTSQFGIIQLGGYTNSFRSVIESYVNFNTPIKISTDSVWSVILSTTIKYWDAAESFNGYSVHLFAGTIDAINQNFHLDLLHEYHDGVGVNCDFQVVWLAADTFYIEATPRGTVRATYALTSQTLQYTQASNEIPKPYEPPTI